MKSLSKIISEVELLSEKKVDKKAARKQQVQTNIANNKPRYVLTMESRIIDHPITGEKIKLKRIKGVDGDNGGWAQFTSNLSLTAGSNAWISEDSMVFGNAKILENAQVHGYCVIFGDTEISGDADIEGSSYGKCGLASGKFDKGYHKDIVKDIDKTKFELWGNKLNSKNVGGSDDAWKEALINDETYKYTINTDDSGKYISKKVKDPKNGREIQVWQIKRKVDDEIGGWIQSEKNLSENAWVKEGCVVMGNAEVYGNAIVGEDSSNFSTETIISGNAVVRDKARVDYEVKLSGDVEISGKAYVKRGSVLDTGTYNDIIANVNTANSRDDREEIVKKLLGYPKGTKGTKRYALTSKKKKIKNISKHKGILKRIGNKLSAYDNNDEVDNGAMIEVTQIKRLSDGSLGGWVQSEKNLNQAGSCWLSEDSFAYGNARIRDNAIILNGSVIYDNSTIKGNAVVSDSKIGGDVEINNKDIDGVVSAVFNSKVGNRVKAGAKAIGAIAGAGVAAGATLQNKGLLF